MGQQYIEAITRLIEKQGIGYGGHIQPILTTVNE